MAPDGAVALPSLEPGFERVLTLEGGLVFLEGLLTEGGLSVRSLFEDTGWFL